MDAYDDEDAEDNTARIFGSGNPGMTFYKSNVQVRLSASCAATRDNSGFSIPCLCCSQHGLLQKQCAAEAQPAMGQLSPVLVLFISKAPVGVPLLARSPIGRVRQQIPLHYASPGCFLHFKQHTSPCLKQILT